MLSKSDNPTPLADFKGAKGGGFGKGKSGKSGGPIHVSVPPGLLDSKAHWEWHITETFKGLGTLSIEALKALLLINGGAAVAMLRCYLNFADSACVPASTVSRFSSRPSSAGSYD